jgi:ribonuclease P protein component
VNRKFSLRNPRLIQNILTKGRTVGSPFLVIKFDQNQLNNSQFCVIVSNKISKSAVIRNKLKRRIKESIRLNMELVSSNLNVIILPKQKSKEIDYQNITQEIKNNFQYLKKASLKNNLVKCHD